MQESFGNIGTIIEPIKNIGNEKFDYVRFGYQIDSTLGYDTNFNDFLFFPYNN